MTVYLDDIVIHDPSNAEHDYRLETLERLADHYPTLNSKRCSFGQTEIKFMGYKIDVSGLKPIHSKFEAIVNIPTKTKYRRARLILRSCGIQYSRTMLI